MNMKHLEEIMITTCRFRGYEPPVGLLGDFRAIMEFAEAPTTNEGIVALMCRLMDGYEASAMFRLRAWWFTRVAYVLRAGLPARLVPSYWFVQPRPPTSGRA